jgi:hypothetical protein
LDRRSARRERHLPLPPTGAISWCRHPRLGHDIVNRFTLEFFDKYLRDAQATPLLSQEQVYPDTELLKSAQK